MEHIRTEKVLDREYHLEDIEPADQEAAIAGFFRTKDKHIAAFLKARGFRFRGLERVQLANSRKTVVAFCFDGENVTRRTIFEYYNNVDRENWTVNAKMVLEEYRNINSLIANF